MSDTSEFDLTILCKEEKLIYSGFKSTKRKSEYYFTRVLWKEFGIDQEIKYNEYGRPFLKEGFISISHSHDIVVIAFNAQHQIGIDVEYKSQKISAIKHKFISVEDEKLIDHLDITHLTIAWSIKEAVYKMENIHGLSFKDNIHVKIENNLGYVNVNKDKETHMYTFQYFDRSSYVLTYCNWGDLGSKISESISTTQK